MAEEAQMDFKNSYDGIDDYAVRIIKHKARKLIGCKGFSKSDREDLEQELVYDLLCRLPKFDSEKAQLNTFIVRVVENRIATIIEERQAGKRDWRLCTTSFNDRLDQGDNKTVELQEVYDMDEYLRQTGRFSRNKFEHVQLRIDLGNAIEALPPELRSLCNRLQTESVTEISRNTGIPRGTLYDRIKKLRVLFEDRELRNYF